MPEPEAANSETKPGSRDTTGDTQRLCQFFQYFFCFASPASDNHPLGLPRGGPPQQSTHQQPETLLFLNSAQFRGHCGSRPCGKQRIRARTSTNRGIGGGERAGLTLTWVSGHCRSKGEITHQMFVRSRKLRITFYARLQHLPLSVALATPSQPDYGLGPERFSRNFAGRP